MWRKFWLLFTVIWAVVAALQVFTLLAFSEEPQKVWQPLAFGIGVPLVLYALGWVVERLRRKP